MAIVSPIPIRRDVPGEPGEWIEFRKLSWRQLRDARKKQEAENREDVKQLGADFVAAIIRPEPNETEAQQAQRVDRAKRLMEQRRWDVDQFDLGMLLTKGIAAWSYAVDGHAVAVDQGIDLLEPHTAEWAGEQVIALSRPPSEDDRKNEIGSSTGS